MVTLEDRIIDEAHGEHEKLTHTPNSAASTPILRSPVAVPLRVAGLGASAVTALEQRRLFILMPFAAIVGLCASLSTPVPPDPLALWIAAIAIAVAAWRLRHSGAALRLGSLAAAFWLGFCLLSLHGAWYGTEMLARAAYGTYEARVDAVLSVAESGRRVILSDITPGPGERDLPIRRARVIVREGPPLAPGDRIRAPVRFYPVPGPVLPGGYDTQFHAYFDGIGAYGTTTDIVELLSAGSDADPFRGMQGLRGAIAKRIDANLAQPASGIARALITGDQSQVDDTARKIMATAGLAHVLSVSGLHLTLVAGTVFTVVRIGLALMPLVSRGMAIKPVAAGMGIAAGLFYYAISGGNVAATRATLMIILVFGAVIVGRRALTMRNVAMAALIVLLMDPASVFRPSFQLSFAAVVALIGAWELARRDRPKDNGPARRLLGYFTGLVVTSLVAGAATLLFSIYHFQQTSPLGVVGNLFSLPLVGMVMMPAAMLAAIAMPLGLETVPLQVMGWSIDVMLTMAAMVAAWSSGLTTAPLLTPWSLLLGLAALAWFAYFINAWRLLAPALLLPAVWLLGLDHPPDILVADTTQAIATRQPGGLQLVAGRASSFAVDVWRETYGEPLEEIRISCDSIACVGRSAVGFRYAIVTDPAGFFEECTADLVITRRHAPTTCDAGMVVDAGDLERHGVHWLRWDAATETFELRRAMTDLARPWRGAR